jgi:acyl-CoA thioester hydrolase
MRRDPPVDSTDPMDRGWYTAWETDRIRFSDTDAMGHVNNVAVAAFVETGRVALGMELAKHATEEMTGFILARLAIDYRSELSYPGMVDVGSRVLRVGRTSYTVATGVFDGDVCAATAEGVLVMLGPDGPAEITGRFREELERQAAS